MMQYTNISKREDYTYIKCYMHVHFHMHNKQSMYLVGNKVFIKGSWIGVAVE